MSDAQISVLYFSNTLVRGGAEEHILTLLRGLDRSRFRPLLACTPAVAARLRADLPEDVVTIAIHLRRPGHVGPALHLARLLRRERVSVLHSHLFYSSLFASPIGRLCRVPFIVETPHVREQWRTGLKARFVVDRFAGHFVDHYIAVSKANRRYLVEEKRLPSNKIAVIHNGSDLKKFDPQRTAPQELRRSLGFQTTDPVLVVIGRLERQKGQHVLLEALATVRRTFPATRLVCVGEGTQREDLGRQADALGLRDAVRFVGQRPDIPDWLVLADLTVLPSFYEGLPLAAIESLAAGRAIVATAVDGTPEVVVDGSTGLTVPPGDVERLASAIMRLLADPALRRRLARAGREHVVARFDEKDQVARTQNLYEWGLRRRQAGETRRRNLVATGSER